MHHASCQKECLLSVPAANFPAELHVHQQGHSTWCGCYARLLDPAGLRQGQVGGAQLACSTTIGVSGITVSW